MKAGQIHEMRCTSGYQNTVCQNTCNKTLESSFSCNQEKKMWEFSEGAYILPTGCTGSLQELADTYKKSGLKCHSKKLQQNSFLLFWKRKMKNSSNCNSIHPLLSFPLCRCLSLNAHPWRASLCCSTPQPNRPGPIASSHVPPAGGGPWRGKEGVTKPGEEVV